MTVQTRIQMVLLHPLTKPVLTVLLFLPLAQWVWLLSHNHLGINPAETLIRASGEWALRLLLLTLCIRPLRVWFGLSALLRLRRRIGLICYAYALLHLLCYVVLDQGLDGALIAADILKRPFVWVGFVAFVLLSALALSSNNASIRRLGAGNWQRLHRLIYLIGILVILHFVWVRSGKQLFGAPLIYGTLLALLLLWRLRVFMRRQQWSLGFTARWALQQLLR